MSPVINWDEGKPAGGDSLGIGDDEIRSTKSAIRTGLDAEHIWPSSGGDAGVHRLGSARPYVGAQSLVSSTGTDGRLQWTSDSSQFFHVGSGGTAFIGGARVISAGSYPGTSPPQRSQWVMEFGEGRTDSGITSVNFPNSGYSGKPVVTVTPILTSIIGEGGAIMWVRGVSNTGFIVDSRLTNGATASTHSFCWISIGTRTL